ncbi:MAG: 1-acyl-sn-glycerol-3-phosphate acyltransferase [Myxococcota bacterium]
MEDAPRHEALAERHGTGMLRRFGWFYKVLAFGSRLAQVRIDDPSVDRIRDASNKGPVVYVLAHASAVDHLALNSVLNRRRLPLSVWSNGVNSFYWQPVAAAWRDLWRRLTAEREDPVRSGWLRGTVRDGNVVALFLDTPRSLLQWLRGETPADPFEAVLAAQAASDRPIQLVPVIVLWTRAPVAASQVRNFLLGRSEAPGPLGQLMNVWFRSEGALVQVGEPVDLAEFTSRARPDRAGEALRRVLRRYLRRESTILKGPRLLPYAEMKRVVLENPAMRELARTEAQALGVPVESIRAQMEKEYEVIASNFRWWVVRMSDVVLRPIWTRVFSGVDVRPEDMERIRAAMRNGSAVLLPCHKSHFDYILLSWVFYQHDLIVPHVIAGANLNIWPVSVFLRSVGGLFIKRSFAGERIHPAVFSRYLRELIFRGYPVEFYLEGGRTRSGKLLPPRVGVLGMVFDATERRPTDHEVTLLPISLAYEEVAEEKAYVREAGGEEKHKETVGQLVKARSVLSRRFGRVYLRVGEPIPCSELVDPLEGRPVWSERTEEDRKHLLHQVGERVIHRIANVTVVLPTCLCAAALLAHHRRGMRQDALLARIERFRAFLRRRDAMEAASLVHFDQAIRTALDRLIRSRHIEALELDGDRIWNIDPGARIGLEFYKNQLLQYFAPAGFVAMALRARPDAPQPASALLPDLTFLLWTWRREFRFDPDARASDLLLDGLEALRDHGAVTEEDGLWRVVDPERMGEIHALFRNFAEAYLIVLRSADQLGGHDKSSFPKHLAGQSEALLAAGSATRPESLSTITLGNAVSAFVESGVFTSRDGKLGGQQDLVDDAIARLAPMVE